MMSDMYISQRFRKAVTLHVIKNLLPSADGQVPLILGIHGPAGSGKTYQCERLLSELQVVRIVISGGELESPDAGAPARLIRSAYLKASGIILDPKPLDPKPRLAAILINDIDTAIGDFGQRVQYTVNRQMVCEELMHRADYPREVEGISTCRIPIILTGNDFTKLYPPLVRSGRMTSFRWEPTSEETQAMVRTIFPTLSSREIETLVREYPNAQIATFRDVRSRLIDDHLYEIIKREGPRQVIDQVRSGKDFQRRLEFTYREVAAMAEELITQGAFVNHLEVYR